MTMTAYDTLREQLSAQPRTWLVTGCAGFIGSNLLEALLRLGQTVIGLDNFSPPAIKAIWTKCASWWATPPGRAFTFIEGDIRDADACARAVNGVDYVLHQARWAACRARWTTRGTPTTTISTAFAPADRQP